MEASSHTRTTPVLQDRKARESAAAARGHRREFEGEKTPVTQPAADPREGRTNGESVARRSPSGTDNGLATHTDTSGEDAVSVMGFIACKPRACRRALGAACIQCSVIALRLANPVPRRTSIAGKCSSSRRATRSSVW